MELKLVLHLTDPPLTPPGGDLILSSRAKNRVADESKNSIKTICDNPCASSLPGRSLTKPGGQTTFTQYREL